MDLRRRMDNTVHEAVQTLMEYLKSEGVRERLLDWTQDEILQTFEEVANGRVDQLIQKKLRDVVDEWEEDQFKGTKEYLMRQIRHRFDIFEGELRSLRGNVTVGFPNVPGIDPIPGRANFLGQVVVKISWFFHNWVFPFTRLLRPGFLPSDPQALWEHIERRFLWWWSNQRDIMKKLSEMYLSEVLKESVLTPFVKGRLQEAEQYLSHIQTLIPEQIEADKRLLAQLSGEKRSEGEIIRTYRPILDGTLNIQEKVAFFGLREAGVANICSERLDWKQRVIYTRRWRIFHCVPGEDDKAWRRTGCGAEGLLRSPLSQKCKPYHSGGKSVEVNCSTYESGKKEKYFLCRALSLFALKERVLLEYKTRI